MSAEALVWVCVAVALSATVQLSTGFGFALTSVPLLAIAIDSHVAVVVTLCLATTTNAFQAWIGRADCDRPLLARMLAGAIVGLPIGLLIFVHLDERALTIFIGVSVLVAVGAMARGVDLRDAGPGPDIGGGVLAGALTMSSSVNGPPLVFVLHGRHFSPDRFRGTITTAFLVLDLIGVTVFAAAGDIDADVRLALAVAVPGLGAGVLAGLALRRHLDPARFRVAVIVLLVVAGVSALLTGLIS